MNITLSPELENAVQRKVASGEYGGVDDLIGEAVQRLIDEDHEEYFNLDLIRDRIEAADAQFDRGEYVEYDVDDLHDLAKDVRDRGMKRLASE